MQIFDSNDTSIDVTNFKLALSECALNKLESRFQALLACIVVSLLWGILRLLHVLSLRSDLLSVLLGWPVLVALSSQPQ